VYRYHSLLLVQLLLLPLIVCYHIALCVSLNVADPDSEFLKNPKFRAFQEEMVKELVAFDRVKEWADIIKCLKRVQKVHQPTNT
jgi:hypothetical protein